LTLSGWYSWNHFHDVTAPIAVFVGAGMFHFAETSWHERYRLRALLFGGLAMLAAFISLTGVVSRVGAAVDARLQQRQTENLPRHQAELALGEAENELKTAEAAARQRVADARAKVAGLGARTVEDPLVRRLAAIVPGVSEAQVQLYLPLLFPTLAGTQRPRPGQLRAGTAAPQGAEQSSKAQSEEEAGAS
jgi:hypothetical protein